MAKMPVFFNLRKAILLFVFLMGHSFAQQIAKTRNSQASTGTAKQNTQDMGAVNQAMDEHSDGHDHQMGPHMKMTALREPQPGDSALAQTIVNSVRSSIEKYKDVKAAEADGFKMFLPHVKQKMYHFTNFRYAMEAGFRFNPEHPTSLLYEKTADGNFKLIGAMYTAPARFSEDELNKRVPLSIAQWHQHVNFCRPPKGMERDQLSKNPLFGLAGSISTREGCEAAGGTFYPRIFGWMVHLYPYEKAPDKIWSVERQMKAMNMRDMGQH